MLVPVVGSLLALSVLGASPPAPDSEEQFVIDVRAVLDDPAPRTPVGRGRRC